MALKELTYETTTMPAAENRLTKYTPDELLDLMARVSYDYWHAVGQVSKISRMKMVMEAKLTAVIQSKNWDMLQNPLARQLLKEACEGPKAANPTAYLTKSIMYMEQQATFEAYNYWEAEAESAAKYHQMLTNQLMWYQSENKRNAAEMMTLGSQT
jgi:hypothetical protein